MFLDVVRVRMGRSGKLIYSYPLRSQDGQRLPDDVLGIVALFLKLDGQDLTCANLNMACRASRAETMRTLWGIISFPKMHGSRFLGNYDEYKEFLQRVVKAPGAKYTRHVESYRVLGATS